MTRRYPLITSVPNPSPPPSTVCVWWWHDVKLNLQHRTRAEDHVRVLTPAGIDLLGRSGYRAHCIYTFIEITRSEGEGNPISRPV